MPQSEPSYVKLRTKESGRNCGFSDDGYVGAERNAKAPRNIDANWSFSPCCSSDVRTAVQDTAHDHVVLIGGYGSHVGTQLPQLNS